MTSCDKRPNQPTILLIASVLLTGCAGSLARPTTVRVPDLKQYRSCTQALVGIPDIDRSDAVFKALPDGGYWLNDAMRLAIETDQRACKSQLTHCLALRDDVCEACLSQRSSLLDALRLQDESLSLAHESNTSLHWQRNAALAAGAVGVVLSLVIAGASALGGM